MAGGTRKEEDTPELQLLKHSVWRDSLGSTLLMAVAQLLEVCGPSSSLTFLFGPPVQPGASLFPYTTLFRSCAALPLVPPLAEPPVSCNCTVTVAVPLELATGV